MAVNSTRTTTITYTGDINGTQVIQAAANANSPGDMDAISLVGGDNAIPVPTGGTTPRCATIVKKSDNTVVLRLGGASGHILGLTDSDSITIGTGQSTLLINAAGPCDIRIIWS